MLGAKVRRRWKEIVAKKGQYYSLSNEIIYGFLSSHCCWMKHKMNIQLREQVMNGPTSINRSGCSSIILLFCHLATVFTLDRPTNRSHPQPIIAQFLNIHVMLLVRTFYMFCSPWLLLSLQKKMCRFTFCRVVKFWCTVLPMDAGELPGRRILMEPHH